MDVDAGIEGSGSGSRARQKSTILVPRLWPVRRAVVQGMQEMRATVAGLLSLSAVVRVRLGGVIVGGVSDEVGMSVPATPKASLKTGQCTSMFQDDSGCTSFVHISVAVRMSMVSFNEMGCQMGASSW